MPFTSLLHTQSKKKKKKNPFKTRDDFDSDREYGQYVKTTLQKGMKVRAKHSYERVNEGDYGVYQQMSEGTPPAQFIWEGLGGETYYVFWYMVEILPPPDRSDPVDRINRPGKSCSIYRDYIIDQVFFFRRGDRGISSASYQTAIRDEVIGHADL